MQKNSYELFSNHHFELSTQYKYLKFAEKFLMIIYLSFCFY